MKYEAIVVDDEGLGGGEGLRYSMHGGSQGGDNAIGRACTDLQLLGR